MHPFLVTHIVYITFWSLRIALVFLPIGAEASSSLKDCEIVVKEKRHVVDCEKRAFQSIPLDLFDTGEKHINLGGNPYICDCSMTWFIDRLEKRNFDIKIMDENLVLCAEPKSLKGRQIRNLKKYDVCSTGEGCHIDRFCSKQATCVKADNTYKCVCKAGFTGNGTYCSDIDECIMASRYNCDQSAFCLNTIGGFKCQCKTGFKQATGGRGCVAPKPCEQILKNCPSIGQVCVNKDRSFECRCKEGFYNETSQAECQDTNECQGNHQCSKNAQCINLIGSYRCICREGYTGDGKRCEDLDECAGDQHNCHEEAVCVNRVGGYKCHCKSGFEQSENGAMCVKEDVARITRFIIAGIGVVSVLSLLLIGWCVKRNCCGKRKSKETASVDKLVENVAIDEINMVTQDPFLNLQDQQMFMFNNYFEPDMPENGKSNETASVDKLMENMAIDEINMGTQDPFLNLQDQQMFMFDNYFETDMPAKKGVLPIESAITVWSDDEEDDQERDYDDETYNNNDQW